METKKLQDRIEDVRKVFDLARELGAEDFRMTTSDAGSGDGGNYVKVGLEFVMRYYKDGNGE